MGMIWEVLYGTGNLQVLRIIRREGWCWDTEPLQTEMFMLSPKGLCCVLQASRTDFADPVITAGAEVGQLKGNHMFEEYVKVTR